MPDTVKLALEELRRTERQLSLGLARALRSNNPRRHEQAARQVAQAQRQLQRLERQLLG